MEHIEQRLSSKFRQKSSDKDLDSRLKSASSTVLQQKLAFTPAGKCQSVSYGDNLKSKYIQLTHKVPAKESSDSMDRNNNSQETPVNHPTKEPEMSDEGECSEPSKDVGSRPERERPVAPAAFVHCAPVKRTVPEAAWKDYLLGTAPKMAKAGKAKPKKSWKNLKAMVKTTSKRDDGSSCCRGLVLKIIIKRDPVTKNYSLNAVPDEEGKKAGATPEVHRSKSPAKKASAKSQVHRSKSPAKKAGAKPPVRRSKSPAKKAGAKPQVRRSKSPARKAVSPVKVRHRSLSPVRKGIKGKQQVKKTPAKKADPFGLWQNKYDKLRLKKKEKAVPVVKVKVAPPASKPVCKDISLEPISPSVEESDKFLLPDVFNNTGDDGEGLPHPSHVLFPADGVDYEWKFPDGGPGYLNKGNTCFLNAAMQILTYTPPLVNYALSNHHTLECKMPKDRCAMCNYQLHVKRSLVHRAEAMYPSWFVNNINHIGKHFRFGRQEDAHEFLRLTLEHMQRACLSGHHSLDRYSKDTTVVNQIFGGFLRSQVVCLRCKAKSNTYDPVLDICVDIKNVDTLERAFQLFVTPEKLDLDNAYRCNKCKQKVAAMKRFSIHKPPNILTVQLKRFQYTGGGAAMCGGGGGGSGGNCKITRNIKFPPRLNIRPYMSNRNGPPEVYSLYGVIMHEGWSMNAGHYTCIVRSGPKWFFYSDNQKRPTCYSNFDSQSAYVLFYIKDNHANKYTLTKPLTPRPSPQEKSKLESREPVAGCSTSRSLGSVLSVPSKSLQNVVKVASITGSKPTNDLGRPIVRKPVNSAPLPSNRDKVSFGLKMPDKPSASQVKAPSQQANGHPKPKQNNGGAVAETPGATKPRIVMQIKHGKVTTIETSPTGQRKILSDDDENVTANGNHHKVHGKSGKKARLVPYGNDSNSDSDWSSKAESPKVDVAKKSNDHHERKDVGGVVFDPRLNATVSVPGNAHLYDTITHKEKINHNNTGANEKGKDMKMPLLVPKDEMSSPGKKPVSAVLTCVTSPVASRDSGGMPWQVQCCEAEPSPSIGSSSSTHSNNSTSEWAVSRHQAGHAPTDNQSGGWTVTPGNSETDVHRSDNHIDISNRSLNSEKPDIKAGMKRPVSLTFGSDDVKDKLNLDDNDKVPLLNGDESALKVKKHKKNKKHKKHKSHDRDRDRDRSRDKDHKYEKLKEDCHDSSSKGKHKKKHKDRELARSNDHNTSRPEDCEPFLDDNRKPKGHGGMDAARRKEHAPDRRDERHRDCSPDRHKDHHKVQSSSNHRDVHKEGIYSQHNERHRDGSEDRSPDRQKNRHKVQSSSKHADIHERLNGKHIDHSRTDHSPDRYKNHNEQASDKHHKENDVKHKNCNSERSKDQSRDVSPGKHKNHHNVQASDKYHSIHKEGIHVHVIHSGERSKDRRMDASPDRQKGHHKVQGCHTYRDLHKNGGVKGQHNDSQIDGGIVKREHDDRRIEDNHFKVQHNDHQIDGGIVKREHNDHQIDGGIIKREHNDRQIEDNHIKVQHNDHQIDGGIVKREHNDHQMEDNRINGHHNDHRRELGHPGQKRKHERDTVHENSSHKRSRRETSDTSSEEFEWVERPSATHVGSVSSASTPIRSSRASTDIVGQDWDYHVKGVHQRSRSGGSTPVTVSWDGLRASKVASQLEQSLQYGYGAPVSTWNGGHSEMDVDNGLDQRQHDDIDDYEEDLDRGRVKKVKEPQVSAPAPTGNPFQREQQQRNKDRSMWDSVFRGPQPPNN